MENHIYQLFGILQYLSPGTPTPRLAETFVSAWSARWVVGWGCIDPSRRLTDGLCHGVVIHCAGPFITPYQVEFTLSKHGQQDASHFSKRLLVGLESYSEPPGHLLCP